MMFRLKLTAEDLVSEILRMAEVNAVQARRDHI